jgi:hypothetical protein
MVAMSEPEYECPSCGKLSRFVKKLASQITSTDTSIETVPGIIVDCPVHGEMVIVGEPRKPLPG